MDLAIYVRVLSRHLKLVGVGLAVALLLAVLSVARIELDGVKPAVSYRDDEVWISASTLFVTQQGFPWGRAILDETYGDPSRYPGLAQLYSALATSDAVAREVMADAPRGGSYEAEVVRSSDSTVLPLIYMKGYGPSPAAAETIADRSATIFRTYLARLQVANGIPAARRVQVALLSEASEAEIFAGRSMVRPVFVFLLVLTVFVALAFVVDNVRGGALGPDGSPTSFRWLPVGLRSLPARIRAVSRPVGATTRGSVELRGRPAQQAPPQPRSTAPVRHDERRSSAEGQPLSDEPSARARRSA